MYFSCLYLDSRWNLCFMLTITASVRWEIQQNLRFFVLVFQWRVPTKEFFIKVAGCSLPAAIWPKMSFFCRVFFKFLTKSVDQSFLDGYFFLLLSLKLFSRKKSVLLKLPHLITPLPRLDQSKEIYFAASWWALIIKGRCNVAPLYCSLILRSS